MRRRFILTLFALLITPFSAVAATTFTGTVVVNATVTIRSTFAPGTQVICEADAGMTTGAFGGGFGDPAAYENTEVSEIVVPISAGKAVCSVRIPYSWLVLFPSANNYMVVEFFASATGDTYRETQQVLVHMPLPANGAWTTETAAAAL